jgi:hypothetical protein
LSSKKNLISHADHGLLFSGQHGIFNKTCDLTKLCHSIFSLLLPRVSRGNWYQWQASSSAEQAQGTHEEFDDNHWSATKMRGESGPTRSAILFVKTKKYLKTRELKSAHIYSEESCISLFIVDLQNT